MTPSSVPGLAFDEKIVDAIFANLDGCHLPGAAIGIAIHGKPVYRKGFGLANMEQPTALSPSMRMRIFSVSKHFTSLAYMLLCEEGQAHPDDAVGKYLPELHPVSRGVTFRQLMGNIGGLHDVFDISWHFSGTGWSVPSADLLAMYREISAVNAAPGTSWIYNNGGFLMLSVAIERIAERSLEEVFKERIFDPIGMSNTLLRRFDSDFVPNSATLHMTNPAGEYRKSHIGEALSGEGGIVSTVDDMLRWLAHMDTPAVGSAATWRTLKTPQRLANGTSTGYGLGLVTGCYRGVGTLYHSGGGMGGSSQMLKVPSAGLDIVIMTNREDVAAPLLTERILDTCLRDLEPVVAVSDRPLATGNFRSPKTGRVVQLFPKGAQQIASIDGMDMPVHPDGEGVLWPEGLFSFTKQSLTLIGDLRQPTSIQLSDFGNPDELLRQTSPETVDVRALAGRYRSDMTDTEARICESDDGIQLMTLGRFGSAIYSLECIANGIWRARSGIVFWLGGILLFDDDARAFSFSTYRSRNVIFRRKE
jgi:D-aminopeptidase